LEQPYVRWLLNFSVCCTSSRLKVKLLCRRDLLKIVEILYLKKMQKNLDDVKNVLRAV